MGYGINRTTIIEIITGYSKWVEEYLNAGRRVYLMTFQFGHLGDNANFALPIMRREIERFYAILLTNIIRRPRNIKKLYDLPIMIVMPDRPVFKFYGNYKLSEIIPNAGVHYHGILIFPKEYRLRGSLVRHFRDHRNKYLGSHGTLTHFHTKRIRDVNNRPVDYVFKHMKRGSFSPDEIYILPRTGAEVL